MAEIPISQLNYPEYISNIIEGKEVSPLRAKDFISLIKASSESNLQQYIPGILTNFRKYISSYDRYDFADIVYLLLAYNVNPNLSMSDLQHIPVYDPFDKFIIDISKTTELDYSYFSTTKESRYSSLMPWHLGGVRHAFLSEIPNAVKIVDLTSHIGVDSVFLNILYRTASVISIEIDTDTFLRLRDNLIRFMIVLNKTPEQISMYNADSSYLLNNPSITSADIVYIDPPWGGPEYYKIRALKLYLGSIEATDVVSKLLENGVGHVVLKAPENIDYNDINKLETVKGRKVRITQHKIYTKPRGGKLSYLLFFFSFTR